jgi:hypothetical protein
MAVQSPSVREQLRNHWQSEVIVLLRRGFDPAAIHGSMVDLGLGGYVEALGNRATCDRFLPELVRLSQEAKEQEKALGALAT